MEYFTEINLWIKNWLLCCSSIHSEKMSNHADLLIKKLIFSRLIMTIFLLLGDFNLEMRYSCTKNFCLLHTLKRLIRTPTCFKIPDNLKFIDLVLRSRPKTFYDSDTFETGLSQSL